MTDSSQPQLPRGAALYLAVVQFFFVTSWTIYVIYLPKLLVAAGLPASYTIWILLLDQLVFMVMDVVMGIVADRAGRVLGRIGPVIIAVTAVSCIAFLLIPHAAFLGSAAPAVSLILILVWAATSSALRAPPWVLLSKYAAAPSLPWMNALALSGLAIGGVLAPYLGVALRNVDPKLPFAVSSLTLFAATAGLVWVERALARRPAMGRQSVPPLGELLPGMSLFLIACLALALGFQIHTALNSAPHIETQVDLGVLPEEGQRQAVDGGLAEMQAEQGDKGPVLIKIKFDAGRQAGGQQGGIDLVIEQDEPAQPGGEEGHDSPALNKRQMGMRLLSWLKKPQFSEARGFLVKPGRHHGAEVETGTKR